MKKVIFREESLKKYAKQMAQMYLNEDAKTVKIPDKWQITPPLGKKLDSNQIKKGLDTSNAPEAVVSLRENPFFYGSSTPTNVEKIQIVGDESKTNDVLKDAAKVGATAVLKNESVIFTKSEIEKLLNENIERLINEIKKDEAWKNKYARVKPHGNGYIVKERGAKGRWAEVDNKGNVISDWKVDPDEIDGCKKKKTSGRPNKDDYEEKMQNKYKKFKNEY